MSYTCVLTSGHRKERGKTMKKNKYDLAEDVAWALYEMENCRACFMKNECRDNPSKERMLCSNVVYLIEAIEKKYLK